MTTETSTSRTEGSPVAAGGAHDHDARFRQISWVTWIGVAANLLLALVKIIVGVVGQSQALVADGVHSLSDLFSDGVVLLAARQAARDPDADHPYGHGRIETAATIVVGISLLGTAALLGHNAIESLGAGNLGSPELAALVVALGSVAAKETLFRYTRAVGKRVRSRLLEANAWHHRSDALSSIVVAMGIGGTLAGWATFDAIAAIVVAAMVAKVGIDLIWQSLRELVDTGLDDRTCEHLREQAAAVDGVRHVHTVRSRWMGHYALVDLHVRVGPRVSVSEGHRVAEAVRLALLDHGTRLADVMVHVDPEEDTDGGPSNELPLRGELVERLQARWAGLPGAERVEGVTLHYLGGQVHVQISLAPYTDGGGPANAEAMRAAAAAEPFVGSVTVFQRVAP
ncbi:MAG: cation diffusion facilitator family transporter [Halofilum sp. (in: g-proteobacteria)]